uniref:hypothetical protein n=1 Tax=Xanthomonas vesicatoria TaxID=56460 RepID=UPI0019D24DF7
MYLDWQEQNADVYAVDVETDGLDAKIIWVMCWENIKTKETGVCTTYDEIRRFFDETAGAI